MSALLKALFQLLLPLFREWWRKKNWSAHSIRNMKEIHFIFCMYIVQFALFLYVIDHGLGVFIHYSDKSQAAAIEVGKVEQVITNNQRLTLRNDSLEEQLEAANKLIALLVNNNPILAAERALAPKEETSPKVSAATQLESLKNKYKEQ